MSIVTQSFKGDQEMPEIMALLEKDLSEPYSIYTYRYFIHGWPQLCLLARDATTQALVGVIICKVDVHRHTEKRGYIAMLAVDHQYRKQGLGSTLVTEAVQKMIGLGATEVVLETEASNSGALALYSRLGFCRDKKLAHYYLNGADAFRLKLWLS